MSDIPSAANKVQIEATLDRKPVSQDLLQIMGGSINYLLDQFATFGFQYQLFTANGTWIAPANTTSVILFGCGGGGSGSVKVLAGQLNAVYGGKSAKTQWNIQAVTPGQTYTVLIGSGGSAVSGGSDTPGNAGSSTFFKLGGTTLLEYVGGDGGNLTTNIWWDSVNAQMYKLPTGERSANYLPGTPFGTLTSILVGLGGDAGPFGNGGNAGTTGVSAGSNTGAGGGAGINFPTATSGAGGSGLLYVIWF